METTVKKLYEAMFLVDSAEAAADWDRINATIKTILERVDAEIVSMRKWDERRLVYDVAGKSRGTYILCYFRADGVRISEIEREVQLSERIMRVLILSAEHMSQDDVEKDTPATLTEKYEQKMAAEAAERAKAALASKQEEAAKDSEPEKQEPAEEPKTEEAQEPESVCDEAAATAEKEEETEQVEQAEQTEAGEVKEE